MVPVKTPTCYLISRYSCLLLERIVIDSLSLKSLSLIEKVYGISVELIWVSAKYTASTWNLDIIYCSLLYF